MKHYYTLVLLLLLSFSGLAQNGYSLTFEDTTFINQFYYTDSMLDPAGIWQIGKPNKLLFDSAYNSTNAVVTLLDSALPANTKASFIFTIPGYQAGYFPGAMITFANKFDFDTAHGGAYVEFTIDSGVHWHSVLTQYTAGGYYSYNGLSGFCYASCSGRLVDGQSIFPPMWINNVAPDTTANGVSYFSGTSADWMQDTIIIPSGCIIEKTNQLTAFMLKFTAFADSNSQVKAGWMIDNIQFNGHPFVCLGAIEEINSSHLSIYPDPVLSMFTISLIDQADDNYVVSLYDIMGRELIRRNFTGREISLKRDGLAAGSYMIKVSNSRTGDSFEKRVLFE